MKTKMAKKSNSKERNYLVCGGVVGFVLSLIAIICRLATSKMCFDGPDGGACVSELSIIFSSSLNDVYATYGYLISYVVLDIVAGALIGWGYGWMKSRRK